MSFFDDPLNFWRLGKKIDPLTHKVLEAVTKRQSKNVARLADDLGMDWVAQHARKNAEDPEHTMMKKSAGAGLFFGGKAAWPYLSGTGTGKAATAGTGLATSGLFASDVGQVAPAATQNAADLARLQQLQAMQQAAQYGGELSSLSDLSGFGMFGQIPGVTSGSPQAQMLAEQTGMFGGRGADLTAQSAMPAVKDAYRTGQMGTMDYLGNVAKADAAGMNDPRVWLDRLGRNAGRISGGNYMRAGSALLSAGQRPQQALSSFRAPQGQLPAQIKPEGDDETMRKVAAEMGVSFEELKRRLAQRSAA